MPEFQSLAELESYIRQTLPESRQIQKLRRNDDSKFVDFFWHQRHFAVKETLEVFEIKDRKRLLITASSRLVQAALMIKDKNGNILKLVVETMASAEERLRSNPEQGLALIGSVKATLQRMIRK